MDVKTAAIQVLQQAGTALHATTCEIWEVQP
ncbi:winged helix-turn-helix domain-containing protein [Pseudodesulfovibrio profundus]|nr:winged helix-turn-helix domain-containing protein [Pseudodesulfovibrio profundus]